MKTHIKSFLVFFISLVILFLPSCKDDPADALEVSSSSITVSADTRIAIFTVICAGKWEIRSKDAWCTTVATSGTGTMDVKVKAAVYNEVLSRQTTLTITSGKEVKTVTVTQPGIGLSLEFQTLDFPAEGGTKTLKLLSENFSWTITPITDAAITVNPMNGTGNKDLTITVAPNPTSKPKTQVVSVNFNSLKQQFTIQQAGGPNNAPSVPELNFPTDNSTGVFVVPEFRWASSTDTDGDKIKYLLYYSEDKTNWTLSTTTNSIRYTLTKPLSKQTTYYWKVVASDSNGGETASAIYKFTTNNQTVPADGSYSQYAGGALINGSIPIIFTGDGFTAADYVEGGNFDKKIDEGIEAFFATEPYKSYRSNFKVYKVVAYSAESGASRWNESTSSYSTQVLTAFDTRYYGNGYNSTFMTTNCDKVYSYAMKIPGVTGAVLDKTTVVLVVNDPIYSGTCWQSQSGRSVSIVPTCDGNQPYSYKMTMAHEAGGHGFGRLADEYKFSDNAIDAQAKTNILNWVALGANANIDLTGDRSIIKWKHFFNLPAYKMVGAFPGAQYASGVWMPEYTSGMRDMTYVNYNAPSREAIVKRIKLNLGETYSFDEFVSKDVIPSKVAARSVRSNSVLKTTAHTSPQKWVSKK